MSTLTNGNAFDFDNLTLADIDPEIQPIPEGEYNFQVVSAERPTFTYKQDQLDKGISAGDESTYIKFSFAVINDAEHAGRKVYQALFPDKNTPRFLRLLMDATGVPQNGTINEWLEELVTARATFQAPIFTKLNKKTSKNEATVRFASVKPID